MGSFYKKEGGKFHLFNDVENGVDEKGQPKIESEFTHASEKVAVAWTRIEEQQNRVHVFTHGTPEGMQKWVQLHNGHSPHKAVLKVFDQSTPVEILNKAIVDQAFFATLI